jgi:urate oxidase
LQTVSVALGRTDPIRVVSGIDGLVILKTTHSEFTGYIKNAQTTLPESTDRIFGTRATVTWEYRTTPNDYEAIRSKALGIILSVFADHHSLSVQHTLYDIGEALLKAIPGITRTKLTMPNLHCNLVDLSRFGQDNPNQIFVPIDEPHGTIEAVMER